MITDLIAKVWENTTHNLATASSSHANHSSNNNDLEEERRIVVRRSSRPLDLDLDDTSSLCDSLLVEQQNINNENQNERNSIVSMPLHQSTPGVTDIQHNGGTKSPLAATIPSSLSFPSTRGTVSQQNSLEQYDLTGKVMLLGDSGVGKTCLLIRFRDGIFLSGNYITTVGIDFRNKVIDLDGSKVKLQIWDTAGQERFRSVTHAYYRDAHALLLLYDVTNKTSFDNTRAWLGEIREYAQDDVVIMLLGNKADCGNERVVRKEDGVRLAKEYNVAFMETSAKSGLNVENAFLTIARQLKNKNSGNLDESRFNIQDYVRDQTQRVTCPPCNT